jgi:hypothetical protein
MAADEKFVTRWQSIAVANYVSIKQASSCRRFGFRLCPLPQSRQNVAPVTLYKRALIRTRHVKKI